MYKPTGLTQIASRMIKGDLARVGGGIRRASKNYPRVLNVEFLEVLHLQENLKLVNPTCRLCNKKMKSKGKNHAYQCVKCGNVSSQKILQKIPREIHKKLYLPVPSAHRHLTRPLQRIGITNQKIEFGDTRGWFLRNNIKNNGTKFAIKLEPIASLH